MELDIILENEYGKEVKEEIYRGYVEKPITLRVNRLKSDVLSIKDELDSLNIKYKDVPWYSDALILQDASLEDIKKTNIYNEGKIYLQSLSSMIPPLILDPKDNETILDMAAAPGSKTTQLASLSSNNAMITAVEKNKIRAERLIYNIKKQGATKVNVMIKDAIDLDDFFTFDKILLDAPCTGTGTITSSENNFSKELLDKSCYRQKLLIKKALKLLKKGGILVYSTCSILKEENEFVINDILKTGEFVLENINLDSSIPLLKSNLSEVKTIKPTLEYEGFFIACLRKI